MTKGTKTDDKEVRKIVEEVEYILLGICQNPYKKKRVIIQDSVGYKYDISFWKIYKKHDIANNINPFSLENISLYLKLNNRDFELKNNNKYIGSHKKLAFICNKCKENFYMSWGKIKQGQGCPYCAGRRTNKYNNLVYLNPELASQWHPNKNKELSPDEVTIGSYKIVWWLCSICGYEWCTTVFNRSRGRGCPSCSGFVVTDNNRLSLKYPELVEDWDFIKNGDLLPSNVSFGSEKKVWWKCKVCGYEWEAIIYSRSCGNGCSECASSKGEKRVVKFLNENYISYTPQYRFTDCRNKKPLPFDFYLLDYKTLIEYQGIQHYKEVYKNFWGGKVTLADRQRNDKIKLDYCKNNNIPLLVIPYWDFNNIETILQEYLFKEKNVLEE